MNRRSFLAVAVASLTGLIWPSRSKALPKELVLDYANRTDPLLFRSVILTDEFRPNRHGLAPTPQSHYTSVLDAQCAWVLPDGRLEVERYVLLDKPSTIYIDDRKVECPWSAQVESSGEVATRKTILTRWAIHSMDARHDVVARRGPLSK